MPILGAPLDCVKLEVRNQRVHQLSAAPASPVTGQLYYDTTANVLYYWNGTAWISAAGGSPPDATATTKGVVQLAGDLTGTAAAPTVANNAITSAKIADGTITDVDVAATNKDGAVGTYSMRTLGLGAAQAMPGNEPLNLITAPTGDLSLNTHKITGLVDPTNPQDAATKNYADNLSAGLDAKGSCKAASTGANLTLSGTQTVDGIALIAGDRCLVKDQTTVANNGIYVVAAGAWARATDMDAWAEVPSAYTWVEQGTVNSDTGWVCTSDQGGTLNTTAITWTKFSSANLGANAATYYSTATHGAGTTITVTQATHLCRPTQGLHVQVQDATTGNVEIPDISVAANGDVTVTYAAAVAANSKRVTIIG
jgi:hypothetical protein